MSFAALVTLCVTAASPSGGAPRERVVEMVSRIQQADYADDRAALERLYQDLEPFVGQSFGSRVRYWRGFALWRRAVNGFNDQVPPAELEKDLVRGADEFEQSERADPAFLDAKIGEAGCLSLLLYLHAKDPVPFQSYAARAKPLLEALRASAPTNPRLCWILGPMYWSGPAEKGGQRKALELYASGLEALRSDAGNANDPLEPSWGEPELLMSLAWSRLHQSAPDAEQAEGYARAALKWVPAWHYVRDILLPQIEKARQVADGPGRAQKIPAARP
jgi:hypothetical protein